MACAETQEGEERQAGSTATVVLARNDKVVVANVGDSRAVLCRNGQPQDLSTEHRSAHSCCTACRRQTDHCSTSQCHQAEARHGCGWRFLSRGSRANNEEGIVIEIANG